MKAPAQALLDFYRCPEAFVNLGLRNSLSEPAGFFQFGSGTICYGRSSSGFRTPRVESVLYDALEDVLLENSHLVLPFDPTEVINNLRLENYVQRSKKWSLAKRLYYFLRPILSASARRRIQKTQLRNWRSLEFPRWPVDTTVEDLCERLLVLTMQTMGVSEVPFVWFWPKGARGAVMITHDVETKAGKDFCASLMDIDDSFGMKASFQIVPEQRYEVTTEWLDTIRERGFDVGLQDLNHDGRLFDEREEFLRRAKKINHYASAYLARGFRAGALYRRPEWNQAFDFSFDMSVPNVAHLDPQRGGCCTVFPFFIGNILELPVTTTQDYMLFHLLDSRSIQLWKTQLDLIFRKNGLASFIIHPDYLLHKDARSIYESLLSYIREVESEAQIWITLPSAVDRWWRARSQMRVVRDGQAWRIEGQGSEQTILAYARVANDQLVYDLQLTPA